jgi:hypothetical protein
MGFLDKVKGALRGNESKVKKGIDTAAQQSDKVVPAEHRGKVDTAASKAKDAVDKLGDSGTTGTAAPGTTGEPGTGTAGGDTTGDGTRQ